MLEDKATHVRNDLETCTCSVGEHVTCHANDPSLSMASSLHLNERSCNRVLCVYAYNIHVVIYTS